MSAESERRTETIPQWKQDEVEDLLDFIDRYESIGIVGVTGIPSRQLQQMRADLYGIADIRMSRNTLMIRALTTANQGLEVLESYVTGQVALVGTDENPFGLYQHLEASKTPAPINAGETAPTDIIIPEGDTGMDPGPFVGDLQSVGAAAQIVEGSIKVMQDSVVATAGDVVDDELANVLSELGIEPKEVGLDLRAVYSDGVCFEADDLVIDIDAYRADVEAAAGRATTLSLTAAYPTARTVRSLLSKARGEAKSVGLAASIESPSLANDLVRRADSQVRALANLIDDEEALPEHLRGVTADQPQPADETEEPTDETDDAEADADEAEADEADVSDTDETDDDDDDVSGEGLGDLFG